MDERAQTTFDFAVGITLFLLVVGFAFATVPGFLAPYEGGGEAEAIVADRVATELATDRLADGERYVLSASATDDLLAATLDDELKGEIGVDAGYGLNVTVWADGRNCPSGVADCRLGGTPPTDATVSTSRRVVSVGGEQADLTVRVWG
jgi:hypothetical protein